MTNRFLTRSLTTAALFLALSSLAQAQATRTWVSGVGDDANPCSRTAPCKTFAGAISKTAAGGEISVLDPGGFGVVTITKAITINGDGTLAGILSSGTTGIIVNAGVNDRVVIRSLSIDGAGTGLNGIRFLAGKELVVVNTSISNVTGTGIDVALNAANGTLEVKNVVISNAATGIRVNTTVGTVVGLLDNVDLNGLTTGLQVSTGGNVTVRNSQLSRNGTGILADTATSVANVEFSNISFCGTGVNTSVSGATARLNNSALYTNGNALAIAVGATISSTGNNRVEGPTQNPNGAAVTLK
jgi:hypothetical protein